MTSVQAPSEGSNDVAQYAPTVAVVVPVYRPGATWARFVGALAGQSLRPIEVLVISSGATDAELQIATAAGFSSKSIDASQFDHGGTRQMAAQQLAEKADVIVFLTQDAILASDDALAEIIRPFNDKEIGAVSGRQLPHSDASPIARHARNFNYPDDSRSVAFSDRGNMGIKAAFCSNSFAAYRVSAWRQAGGFPVATVHAEDMHLAGRMLKAGWKVAYAGRATVYHSHNYSIREELSRCFDTGAFHADNPWLLKEFGEPAGEGKRFVISELRFLLREAPSSVPRALINTLGKLLGYKLGRHYRALPRRWCFWLGMNKAHWKRFET